jgi:hypothetical protein
MPKPQRVVASEDASLGARVVDARALHYTAGENLSEDRPAHVRAGSALGWFGGRIAVIQDDANFVAIVDPTSGAVDALALAPGAGGVRCFDDGRANKAHKLDLEACIVYADRLIAFGSGSTPNRERLVIVDCLDGTARVADAAALYTELRSRVEFSGSELNVEGAAVLDENRVVLLQRGNGAARGALQPVNAIGEIALDALLAFVERDCSAPAPELTAVTQYELGAIDGVSLTFTDGVVRGGDLLFLAAAEASPDAVRDGVVVGVALGIVDAGSGSARWTRVLGGDGAPFTAKAEGLLLDRTLANRAFAVIDVDDPGRATELVDIELSGF